MSSFDKPFSDENVMPPYNDMWAKRREVSAKMKQLALQLVTKKSSVESLDKLEKQLDEALTTLADDKDLLGRMGWFEDEDDLGTYRVLSREITPVTGNSSPISPGMHIWFDEEQGKSYARVTCNWLYEGPPNCVHGGIVSALFDDFLGCTQLLSSGVGATGTLNIRYHAPTPLNKELRLEGHVKSVHGRKIICEGEMYADGKLTASAEGLFVAIQEGVMNLSKRDQVKDESGE